jgi:formate dehydrogenase major subunit
MASCAAKGKFIITEYIATDEKTGPRFPLLLTTGRILSQCRRADAPHRQLALAQGRSARNSPARRGTARHPRRRLGAARQPLGRDDVARKSPIGWRRAWSTPVPSPRHEANVISTDYSDWATNYPEYKVATVQVSPSNGPSRCQEDYEKSNRQSRRIASVEAAE